MTLNFHSTFQPERKLQILEAMLMARHGDLLEQSLIRQGKGWFHIAGMGHEALAALGVQLQQADYAFPYYRDRALVLSKGHDNQDLALSFFAKKASSSAGRQLPGHFSNKQQHIWSHLSPVAAHLLPAAGAAWGMQMDGKSNVVYASVGEAASRQGDFYEAVAFAKERQLPIIFAVHDGKVSISTRTAQMAPLHIGALNTTDWNVVDGSDVAAVYRAGYDAIHKARSGRGPSFLWIELERLSSHSSADDQRNYRTADEIALMLKRDPIERFKQQLISEGILDDTAFEALEASIKARVLGDFEQAERAENPKAGEEMLNITGPVGEPQKPVLELGSSCRMADAVNTTFKHALTTDVRTCFFGEDIEDPLGGVFRLTKGLSSQFPERVFNSPLAESTILGIASGLASYGKFPIFEIQFIDFIMPAWNQLVNNLAGLRWRSNGDWQCPCIIYAPYGGYLPAGGIWHSQAQESAFAHFPGMHIVIPTTPEDVSGLILTALQSKDPVLVLLPKHLLWATHTITSQVPVPIGKAAVRTNGTQLTLVTWGNGTDIAHKALAQHGTVGQIELIDLRSIQPWDKACVLESVRKTRRLLVVQEDSDNCSVGQMIITEALGDPSIFSTLLAAPKLVSKATVNIGFNPIYEYSALPSQERVLDAINELLGTQVVRTASAPVKVEPKAEPAQTAIDAVVPLRVPNLGEGLREARIMFFFKNKGDTVKKGEPLCEIETDKAVFPIESFTDGVLEQWDVQADATVQVGQVIGQIRSHEAIAITETKVLTKDVEQPVFLPAEVVSQVQAVVPANLTTTVNLQAFKALKTGDARKVTPSIATAWCILQAMREHPQLCRLIQGNQASAPLAGYDFGVAVALENDVLQTAVIPNANHLSWTAFNEAYRQAVKAVKNGVNTSKARTPVILSSMGTYQIRQGTPIVVPPAMAVIFIGEAFYEYQRNPDMPTLEEVASVSITFDHRFINGAGGARFLNSVKRHIEQFVLPE